MSGGGIGRGSVLLLVAGLAGLASFITLNRQAFPTAALKLEIDRAGAAQAAARFAEARGLDLAGRERSVIFGSADAAAVFLQRTHRELGEASRDMAEFPIWRWEARWFRSEEKEEIAVHVGLRGQVTRYEHVIPEAAEGASLDLAAARRLAEDFLTGVMGEGLGLLEEVEASSKQLEHRADHSFEWRVRGYERPWKESDPEAGVASRRHRIRVQGDEVGSYQYYYKVPERFEREYKGTTSRGLLLSVLAIGLMVVIGLAAVVVAVRAARRERIAWRFGFACGAALLLAYLVMTFNTWPQIKAQYATQIPYGVYLGIAIALQAILGLVYGLLVLVCAAAGELESRRRNPAIVEGLLHPGGPRFLAATVQGYGFGFLFLGYVTVFYLLGRRHLGVWMPAEGPLSEILSTAVPFLAPLSTSIVAAVSEESTFRLFAIPFFARLLGGRRPGLVVGLALPAAIWAFAHSNYPVFPVWVRGIELTVAGIAFGILYLRSGILAAMIAHYVIDAIFLSTPLVTSGNPGLAAAGLGVIGLAAAPAAAAVLLRRREAESRPEEGPGAGAATAGDSRDQSVVAPRAKMS